MMPGHADEDDDARRLGNWAILLEVFDAVQPRVGQLGHDDRWFSKHCTSSRSTTSPGERCPGQYGNWNSFWKRFWRLSRSGTFDAFLQLFAETSQTAHLVQMSDITVVRGHVPAAGAKGGGTIGGSAARRKIDLKLRH